MTTYRAPRDFRWFTRNRNYGVFVARELTSVFVAWAVVFTMIAINAVLSGKFPDFVAFARQPWIIALNLLTLAATAFHAVTFLNLAPKATVVRLDGYRLPAWMIQGGNHSLWLLVSVVIAYFVLRVP
ncbi:hypothetical protein OIE66_12175 [Nonomuraea sp. NBC_01738]|uniref:hypothetical protein n=1 Tax=Nonomuraea sp. NBC_01738 TaxID=2976003 RepID=UPI002E0FA25C|nr:hypothetical protein OIE66_12175 [Nonomuraea sp. NBC_01738]